MQFIRKYVPQLILFNIFTFVTTVSFSWHLALIFIYSWLFFCLLDVDFKSSFKQLVTTKFSKIYLLHLLYILFLFIGVLYSTNKDNAFEIILRHILLIIFPVLIVSSYRIIKLNFNKILLAYIMANTLLMSIYLFFAIFRTVLLFVSSLSYYTIDQLLQQSSSFFFYEEFTQFAHPTYSAASVVLSLYLLYYLAKNKLLPYYFNKAFALFLGVFLAFCVFLLSSKAGLICSVVVLLIILFSWIIEHRNIYTISISIALIILVSLTITTNRRLRTSFTHVSNNTKALNRTSKESTDLRILLWESASEVIKNNFVYGVGTGDAEIELSKTFLKKNQVPTVLNAHNQFIEILIELGIIGLTVFLAMFFIPLFYSLRSKNYLFAIFVLIVIINFLFETMLNRVAGDIFVGFFFSLLFIFGDEKVEWLSS